jgi:hypothetical protein
VADASRRTISRRELQRHESFEQVSPEVGELDEAAFDEALDADPDAALAMLADLTAATDPALRAAAKRLAGRLVLDLGRPGAPRRLGIGRIVTAPLRDEGDIDLDASLEPILRARAAGEAPEGLQARTWRRATVGYALMVDRSGSMGGRPLATSALATAAVAARAERASVLDWSVLAFSGDVVVVKSQDADRSGERVIDDVLTLRGHGTTDLVGALRAGADQLLRSQASRRIGVLLSDCRGNAPGDQHAAARAFDRLVVVAPAEDDDEARLFADAVGAVLTTVSGPTEIPAAIAAALEALD